MTTRELFIEKYIFDEGKGWVALDREVAADEDDPSANEYGERTVEATMPCASCATKSHLDLRMRCLCPEGSVKGTKCIFCTRDHVACLAIPNSLLGAAQVITTFGASMGDRAIRYYRELRADPLSMTRARCAAFGRRFHDLTEANLALRKAIQEEERVVFSVPDSERLAIIQAESVATRRLLSLELEMAIRALEENPMDAEEARRAFTAAQPEYARNNAVYSHLDRCICALRGSHSTPRTEDIDFFEKFTRIGAERYLAIALPF